MAAKSWPEDGSLAAHTERVSLRLHHEEAKVPQEDVIAKGARALVMLKITVAILLVLSAIIVSSLTFVLIKEEEKYEFASHFIEDSNKIIVQFLQETQLKFWTSYSLSVAYTTEFETTPELWPNVSLQRFQVQTLGATALARSSAISFSPIVKEEERESWEAYATENLVDGQRRHLMTDMLARYLQHKETIHRTNDDVKSRDLQTIKSAIFRLDSDGNVETDPGPGPYLPIYQIAPATNVNLNSIFYNRMSHSARNQTFSLMLQTQRPQVSEILNPSSTTPSSVLYFPVGNTFAATASIVGITSVAFLWEDTFRQALPVNTAGVVVVLENSHGQDFTFLVEGQDVVYVGAGDLHDSRYNDMEEVATYNDFVFHTAVNASFGETNIFTADESGNDRRRHAQQQQQGCLYAIRVYPSHEFERDYMTNRPILYSVAVAMIFVFTSAVFMIYECLAGRQQGVVMEALARSSAIVHSLFPENVRDRMMLDAERHIKRRKRRRSSLTDGLIRQRFSYVHGDTPRLKLMSFLKGSRETYAKMEDPELQASASEPIADFFPNTTVMFADIAGFTAWSSDREPSEVFHLLETVWSAFDAIAKRLGVFKIETVGDCYVCVTGLPDPNKDHAMIMTRFAYECLHKMKELTQKLEVELGPGTTDLAMRFGLHSGPVTAGVLRGEKARFQLFGDTMNTAARMESTGQKNRVQISQTTAALLIGAGKEHWFVPREKLVTAKGKGQLQTYWVKQGRMKQTEQVKGRHKTSQMLSEVEQYVSTKTSAPAEYEFEKTGGRSGDVGKWISKSMMTLETSIEFTLAGDKTARLVDWNVDILLGHLTKVVKKRERTIPVYTGGCIVEEVTKRPNRDMPIDHSRSFRLRIDDNVKLELHDFVTRIASLYRDVPFHNFEHASHVAMTANNLMKRITDKDDSGEPRQSTFGIRSDPLSHFAVVFSALVHDVDHKGLTNDQATSERNETGSIAKPSSMELTWEVLMEPRYKHLRSCIYADAFERDRFRQFLINCVKATDVTDMELRALRLKRWNAAFNSSSSSTSLTPQEVNSRKATIVIELIMQTASAAHYSQHWEMFRKWNESLFTEMYQAYRRGGSDRDPSMGWYENEILFFDNHVIPLAKMIKVCGVFAGSNEECLTYALQNRKEWEMKGRDLCKDMLAKVVEKENENEKGGTMT